MIFDHFVTKVFAAQGVSSGQVGGFGIPVFINMSFNQTVANIINTVLFIAGILATIYLVYSGIQYITANGEPAKATAARTGIINAIIGIIVILVAFSISAWVTGGVKGGSAGLQAGGSPGGAGWPQPPAPNNGGAGTGTVDPGNTIPPAQGSGGNGSTQPVTDPWNRTPNTPNGTVNQGNTMPPASGSN